MRLSFPFLLAALAAVLFSAATLSLATAPEDDAPPRLIIVSVNTGGGVGSMFAGLSRLCYAQSYNYQSVTYTMEDLLPFVPRREAEHLHPSRAGPCYGGSPESFNAHYARLYALRRAIKDFAATERDWLVWMENEIFVARPDIKLHDLLPLGDEKRQLIVASDSKLGVSSKLFALRGSAWGNQFLDTWWNMQKTTVDCPRAEGAMMMAITQSLLSAGSGSSRSSGSNKDKAQKKCGTDGNHKKAPRDPEYWKEDHKTPLVRCLAGLLPKSAAAETCAASAVLPDEFKTVALPADSKTVSSSCALSQAVFASKRWDRENTWLRFGTYDDHKRDAVSLGRRFVPRCF